MFSARCTKSKIRGLLLTALVATVLLIPQPAAEASETVRIDTVPLPESPIMIGTWPTPEFPWWWPFGSFFSPI